MIPAIIALLPITVVALLLIVLFRKKIAKKLYATLVAVCIVLVAILTPLSLCLGFFVVGGMGGLQAWDVDSLPGNYEIWQMSARNIGIALREEDSSGADIVIPTYVFEVGYTDTYIFAKQADVPEDYDQKINKSNPNFYIVSVTSGEVFGPYSEQNFSACVQQLGIEEPIHWMSLRTLRQTPYASES